MTLSLRAWCLVTSAFIEKSRFEAEKSWSSAEEPRSKTPVSTETPPHLKFVSDRYVDYASPSPFRHSVAS